MVWTTDGIKRLKLFLGILLALAGQASALNCQQDGGVTSACPASDTYCFSAFVYKNNSAAPTSGLPNTTDYSALPTQGCHNSTVAELQIICPIPADANQSTLVPASVTSYNLLSVDEDTVYYYTCCDATTCTVEQVTILQLDGMPQPPTIPIGFLNLVLLGVITFLAFLGGFLVDIADTNRFIFKEA